MHVQTNPSPIHPIHSVIFHNDRMASSSSSLSSLLVALSGGGAAEEAKRKEEEERIKIWNILVELD